MEPVDLAVVREGRAALISVATLPGERPDASTSAIVSSATLRCSSLVAPQV